MAEEKKTLDGYSKVFDIPKDLQKNALVSSMEQYEEMYKRSIEDPEGFWGEMAEQNIDFYKKWDKVLDYDWGDAMRNEWFKGAKLNVSYNCLARPITGPRKNKAALMWQGEPVDDARTYTYIENVP